MILRIISLITGVVAEQAVQVHVEVVHEHGGAGDRVGCWGGLFGCNLVECWKNAGVACAAIIHEGAIDCLDSGGALLVKGFGVGVWGRDLRCARAVDWCTPLVRRMLASKGRRMVEFFRAQATYPCMEMSTYPLL